MLKKVAVKQFGTLLCQLTPEQVTQCFEFMEAKARANAVAASALPAPTPISETPTPVERRSRAKRDSSAPQPDTKQRDRSALRSPLRKRDASVPAPPADAPSLTRADSAMSLGGNGSGDDSSDDGFTVVTGKKRKKSAKTDGPTKAARTNNTDSASTPAANPRPKKAITNINSFRSGPPPPVIIREKSAWERVSNALKEKHINYTRASSTRDGIRVVVPSAQDHRHLTGYLRAQSIGYHTYALQDEKRLRAVIKGIPKELNTELIKDDLTAQALPVEEVHRMHKASTREPFDMVLVILPLTKEAKEVFNVKTVCCLSGVTVESPRKRSYPGQCHNCQLYGHSALRCFARPRCVKCLEDHGTKECERTRESPTPPSCVLCGHEGHPANYRGCPRAPRVQKPAIKRPPRGPPRPGNTNEAPRPQLDAGNFPPLPVRQGAQLPPHAPVQPTGTVAGQVQAALAAPRAPAGTPPVAPASTQNAWVPRNAPAPAAPVATPAQVTSYAADLALVCRFARAFDMTAVKTLAVKLRETEHDQDARLALLIQHADIVSAIQNFRALS